MRGVCPSGVLNALLLNQGFRNPYQQSPNCDCRSKEPSWGFFGTLDEAFDEVIQDHLLDSLESDLVGVRPFVIIFTLAGYKINTPPESDDRAYQS